MTSLSRTVLPRYVGTTLQLIVIVGTGTAIIGTGTAWLVTATRFPGRQVPERWRWRCAGLSGLLCWPMPITDFPVAPRLGADDRCAT